MKTATFALVAALAPFAASAELFRWVDSKGQVHYTQTPPKDGSYETVRAAPPPDPAPHQDELRRAVEDSEKAEAERQAQTQRQAKLDADRKAYCLQVRERQAYFNDRGSARALKYDEQGNVTRMTDAEFDAERVKTEQDAAKHCSG